MAEPAGTDERQGGGAAAEPSPTAVGAAVWTPATAAVACLGTIGLVLLARASVASASGDGANPPLAVALIVLNAAPIALALVLANSFCRPAAHDFGLLRPALGRAIALLVAVWVGVTALQLLWIVGLGLDRDEDQALAERLGTDGTLTVLVLIVVVTILAPLAEEVVFRGYIFRALRNRWGVWTAAAITGVFFVASHVGWTPPGLLIPVLAFGIGVCLLYEWTGSLYPCIALHAFNNAVGLAPALDWTWQTPLLILGAPLAALALARLLAVALPSPGSRSPLAAA